MSVETVRRVKEDLERRGVSLTGACGALEITKRVAWELRGAGAGLMFRPSRNNCNGFTPDIIRYLNGDIYDCLIDGGGLNEPAWQYKGNLAGDPDSEYRPAFNDWDQSGPDNPPPPPSDLAARVDAMDIRLRKIEAALAAIKDALEP